MMEKILVIGSSNTDLIAVIENFPAAGETISGRKFQQTMGGKGANQALAAHRAGGVVQFITSLGNDAYGLNALSYYKDQGVDVSLTLVSDNISSGMAMIWVDENGENSIVVIPGANNLLSSEYILRHQQAIDDAGLIVLQMEIPYETIKTVCRIATRKKKKVFLNVAPASPLEEEILRAVYMLVVNQTEAELLTGEIVESVGSERVVDKLLSMGVENVVLTLGEKGSIFKNSSELIHVPAFKVKAIDTTAAGDTFCGALVARLSNGFGVKESLEFASAAAAIAVTRMGAQPSIPSKAEVIELLLNKS